MHRRSFGDSIKSVVRGLSSPQSPVFKGDFISAAVKFSVGVPDDALKRLSIKAFINFAKVQYSDTVIRKVLWKIRTIRLSLCY